jgi:hypothetical protein
MSVSLAVQLPRAHSRADHGRGEVYPRFADVRALCAEVLPGASVTRHLAWRYSIVWRRA